MDKQKAAEQSNLAFEFIEKLYFETSYLIKELEGHLSREKEEFKIGQGSGYAINAYVSKGLESPDQWINKKLSVFFAPKEDMNFPGGKATNTILKENLKIIYLNSLARNSNSL